MARITCFGKTDSLSVNTEIKMPLVIIKNSSQDQYLGFIPGINHEDIQSNSLEESKQNLHNFAKELIKNYAKKNKPFPFFISKEQILEDFENVVDISFIKIKSNKRNSCD